MTGLLLNKPTQNIRSITVACDEAPESMAGVVKDSLLAALESLSIDVVLLEAFYTMFAELEGRKADILIQRLFVLADSLDESFWVNITVFDPTSLIPNIFRCCPRLQLVDFPITFYNYVTEKLFLFTSLPTTLLSVTVVLRDTPYVDLENVQNCFNSMGTWIKQCTHLKHCSISACIDWDDVRRIFWERYEDHECILAEMMEERQVGHSDIYLRHLSDPLSDTGKYEDILYELEEEYLQNLINVCYEAVESTRETLQEKGINFDLTKLERPTMDARPFRQLSIKPYLVPVTKRNKLS